MEDVICRARAHHQELCVGREEEEAEYPDYVCSHRINELRDEKRLQHDVQEFERPEYGNENDYGDYAANERAQKPDWPEPHAPAPALLLLPARMDPLCFGACFPILLLFRFLCHD